MTDKKNEISVTRDKRRTEAANVGVKTLAGSMVVAPSNMSEMMDFCQMMAQAGVAVGPVCRENPGAAFAITDMAMRWGISPFQMSHKVYTVKDKSGVERLAYEAQLVNSVIQSRAPIQGRLKITYAGEGPSRTCTVSALPIGEDEPVTYTSPTLAKAKRRSPLWNDDPDQQLAYYSQRAFARRHFPDILMGVYTEDEIEDSRDYEVKEKLENLNKPDEGDMQFEVEVISSDGEVIEEADVEQALEQKPDEGEDVSSAEDETDDVEPLPEKELKANAEAAEEPVEPVEDDNVDAEVLGKDIGLEMTADMTDWMYYLNEAQDPNDIAANWTREGKNEKWRWEISDEQAAYLNKATQDRCGVLFNENVIDGDAK